MKKFIGLALTALMLVGLAACGGGNGNGDDNGGSNVAGNGNEGGNGGGTAVEARGTIVMGTNAEFEPFEFWSGGQIVGIDVAIARAIADELDKDLDIRDMDFTALLVALNRGEVDFVAAGMTINDERRESVDFSIPYFQAMQAIVVAADNNSVQSAADLQGIAVAAIAGYTGYNFSNDVLNLPNLRAYSSPAFAVAALQQGSVDAIVIDYTTARALVNANSDLQVVMDEDVFGSEYYGIAVRQGETDLLNSINLVLQRLLDSGELDEIIAYYRSYGEN